jgi:hypothetical protein
MGGVEDLIYGDGGSRGHEGLLLTVRIAVVLKHPQHGQADASNCIWRVSCRPCRARGGPRLRHVGPPPPTDWLPGPPSALLCRAPRDNRIKESNLI